MAAEIEPMRTTLVDTDFLNSKLGEVIVIDLRHQLSDPQWGEARYREAHIPGARFVHLDRDLSGPLSGKNGRHPLPPRQEFLELALRLGIDGTRQVVVYDQDIGAFAARLWWMINKWIGLNCAALLDGGFAAWTQANLPAESDESPAGAGVSSAVNGAASADHSPVVTMDEVRANIDRPAFLVVDARGVERYLGEVEPMDAVAGHIPGALNRPFATNIGSDGRFKASDALRQEWLGLLEGRAPGEVVHHCGSGVTACHNVLAMEHAGLSGSRIYSGSWSEWCTHPDNPMVIGPAAAGR